MSTDDCTDPSVTARLPAADAEETRLQQPPELSDGDGTEPMGVMAGAGRRRILDEPTWVQRTWAPEPTTEERPVPPEHEDSDATPTLDTGEVVRDQILGLEQPRWGWWLLGILGGSLWLGAAGAAGWWAAERQLADPGAAQTQSGALAPRAP